MEPLAALGKNVLFEVFETHLYSQMENDHCHCDAVFPSDDATYMGILPVNGLIQITICLFTQLQRGTVKTIGFLLLKHINVNPA